MGFGFGMSVGGAYVFAVAVERDCVILKKNRLCSGNGLSVWSAALTAAEILGSCSTCGTCSTCVNGRTINSGVSSHLEGLEINRDKPLVRFHAVVIAVHFALCPQEPRGTSTGQY